MCHSADMRNRPLLPTLVLWLFPVVVVAVIVLLLWGLWTLSTGAFGGRGFGTMGRILVTPLAIALVLGIREARKFTAEPAEGIELAPTQHPLLWAEVHRLAQLAETEPPRRIVIVPEVNASVTEVAGQRELLIGLPLLATFSKGELRSVLAHELGHFAGGDTAASAAIARQVVLLYRVRARVSWLWRWFFTAYAGLYAMAAGPASRQAELRADELSVRAAGAPTAVAALRTLVRIKFAWQTVTESYLPLFSSAGLRAPVGEAVWQVNRANAAQLEAAVDTVLAQQRTSASDTHPPLRDRIAQFQAIGTNGQGAQSPDSAQPAIDLLAGGAGWLSAAEGELLAENLPLTGWDEVVRRGAQQTIAAAADRFGAWVRTQGRGDGGLASVLNLIDDTSEGGVVGQLAEGTGPQAVTQAAGILADPIIAALLAAGAADIQLSWTDEARLVDRTGAELQVTPRIEQAIAAGSSAPLHTWLTGLGVNVAASYAAADVPQWLAALSQMTGPWQGRRDVHLWSTGVLALPQLDKATIQENKQQFSDKHQHPRLYAAAVEGLDAGRRQPDALWLDASRIVGGGVRGKVKPQLWFDLADAPPVELTATLETATVDSIEDVGAAVAYLTAPKATVSR